MTMEDVLQMVKEAGLPVAYHHFEEGQSPDPPFLVYLYPESNNFSADGIVYQAVNRLDIELYTEKKEPGIEEKVEAVLTGHGFYFEKTESYIETERIFEVLYEMEVLISGKE